MIPAHPFIAWDNRFADAVPVASSTALGAAVNLSDFRPYRQWQPVTLPATVTVNCAGAKSADSLSVYSHNLFTGGCTIEVHGSTDNFATSDVTVATKTPTSNLPFVLNFTSASYQYWRIRITGTSAPTLSICALGVGMEFEVGLNYGYGPLDSAAVKQFNQSETGQPLGSVTMFDGFAQTLSFPVVTPAWLRSTFMPAWKAGLRDGMFLFSWKLNSYPDEILLLNSGGKFSAPPISPDYCSLSFDVTGVAL
jgi:hypothetical protein